MDNAQKFLNDRAKARKALLAARKTFLAARKACSDASKEYAKYVIPRPKRAKKAPAKKAPAKKGRRA
jgi:hypothetical protein